MSAVLGMTTLCQLAAVGGIAAAGLSATAGDVGTAEIGITFCGAYSFLFRSTFAAARAIALIASAKFLALQLLAFDDLVFEHRADLFGLDPHVGRNAFQFLPDAPSTESLINAAPT